MEHNERSNTSSASASSNIINSKQLSPIKPRLSSEMAEAAKHWENFFTEVPQPSNFQEAMSAVGKFVGELNKQPDSKVVMVSSGGKFS